MVNESAMNLLFFLGVLIPALVTIALFVVFCYCWYKIRIRNQVLYKKHDPHRIDKLKEGEIYEAPPPPSPPFKSAPSISEMLNYNNNNVNKNKPNNDDYEESPEPEEGFDNPTMYRTNPDSGFSDLNHIQCNVNNAQAARQDGESVRPNSQASDDSDDSGFRSSRSGQYIHSASSSAGNAQETYNGEHSCQVHDAVPLFKPIKIHPNETGRPPAVSYVHRNSSKHKHNRKSRNCVAVPTSSQHYNTEQQSHPVDNESLLFSMNQPIPPMAHSIPNNNCVGQVFNMHQHYSESNNDVHGGRLHSINSHISPLSSVGHFGQKPSAVGQCGHVNNVHRTGYNGDASHLSQPDSIGYSSDLGSLGPHFNDTQYLKSMTSSGPVNTNSVGLMHSLRSPGPISASTGPYPGYSQSVHDLGFIHSDPSCHTAFSNSVSMKGPHQMAGQIPGYGVSHNSSHMRPIQPDLSGHKFGEPLQTVTESPMQLTITEAMIHRPSYIEELSDPSLYSVV